MKIGIVGSSEGNGHPYSWASIINGHAAESLELIPFPLIKNYLPTARIVGPTTGSRVTHVWSPSIADSKKISRVAEIPHVCSTMDQLARSVDAIIHARDDYWNHLDFIRFYSRYAKPVFLDKPIATSVTDLERILAFDPSMSWLFSCSALVFEPRFQSFLDQESKVQRVIASGPKSWDRYSIHLIEPTLKLLGSGLTLVHSDVQHDGGATSIHLDWEDGSMARLETTGRSDSPLHFTLGSDSFEISDPSEAFASALEAFIRFSRGGPNANGREEIGHVVKIIEKGIKR